MKKLLSFTLAASLLLAHGTIYGTAHDLPCLFTTLPVSAGPAPAISPSIPQKVIDAFTAQYPAAKAPRWKKDSANYVAIFSTGRQERHAYYSSEGNWIKTETRIKWIKNLPPDVKKGFQQSEYISSYVQNMQDVESPGRHTVIIDVSQIIDYRTDDLFKDAYRLYFSLEGKLINTETLP